MFNFKKIGKKVLSSVLGTTLAMGSFLNTQIVKAEKPDRDKYWDPYTMLSLAGFILGEHKKDYIKELKEGFEKELSEKLSNEELIKFDDDDDRYEKILEIENNLSVEKNLEGKLKGNLSEKTEVYDSVKDFITGRKADLEKLAGIGELKEIEDFGDGLECKIATFVEGDNKKAIVGVSVPCSEDSESEDSESEDSESEDSEIKDFKNSHMEKIIGALKELEIEVLENKDFKNVYLIIRSKENGKIFNINYDIMKNLENAKVVIPRATFKKGVTISKNSTLIANGAFFCANSNVTVNGDLTANRAWFSKDVTVNGNLTANGAKFSKDVTVNGNLTANGAIFWTNSNVTVSKDGNLTANRAWFDRAATVNGNLTAKGAEFSYAVTVNGNNLTVDISNADFGYYSSCTINAQGSKINLCNAKFKYRVKRTINAKNSEITLTGCDFSRIEFEEGCANLEITIGEDEGGKFYQEYKDKALGSNVFANINELKWEKFKQEQEKIESQRKEQEQAYYWLQNIFKTVNKDTDGGINTNTNIDNNNENNNNENGYDNSNGIDINIDTNNNDILDNGKNNVETKEKSKNWKPSFKLLGISGLICLAVVASIVAFKDKIKIIFGKNQNKKPIAKRIKATN